MFIHCSVLPKMLRNGFLENQRILIHLCFTQILTSRGDIGVFRNTKREVTVPKVRSHDLGQVAHAFRMFLKLYHL